LDASRPTARVDEYFLHPVCGDEHRSVSRKDDLVASGLDRYRSPALSGEPDGGRYVDCARRADHDRRFQAERFVVDPTLIGVTGITRHQNGTPDIPRKGKDFFASKDRERGVL
jgi:hypothetical protein